MAEDETGRHEKRANERRPANDNHAGDKPKTDNKIDAAERLDTVVLSIARLIGRQMAREDFAARIAANDNQAGRAEDDDR